MTVNLGMENLPLISNFMPPHPITGGIGELCYRAGCSLTIIGSAFSIAISNERFNTEELPLYKYLISQSQKGLMFDKAIWESLDINAVNKFKKSEKSVIGFRQFVNTF